MFACLISKLLRNNIHQSLDVRVKKRASLEPKHRLHRQRPIWKAFSSAGQENYLLCVYPDFSPEISVTISLHDWFALGALAADKICFHNAL